MSGILLNCSAAKPAVLNLLLCQNVDRPFYCLGENSMRCLIRVVFAALVISSSNLYVQAAIAAQPVDFQPNTTRLVDDAVYDVNADGTYTVEVIRRVRINTDQGVHQDGQMSLRYSTSLEELNVEQAYTTTKDGKHIDVAPDRILEQQSAVGAQAPMFDDGKVKVIVFPGVEIGATLTLRFKRSQKKPLFPGQFSILDYYGAGTPWESVHLTIRAPVSMKLYVNTIDLDGGRVDPDKPDAQLWKWSMTNRPAHPPELNSVSNIDYSPHVAVSTFPDFAAVGAAYLNRAALKAAVTPAVQALADRLTLGVTDPRQQAEILYNWVSTSMRYVGIYLGFGGVVPHDAGTILDARYGDSKDLVTLLDALLAAKGIKSAPVLVNASDSYSIPKVAVPLGVFNHVITYLPAFNLFVDPTAGLARFGTLPVTELGKPALVTDDGSGAARIVTLPLANPDNARVTVTTQLTIDREGNVLGTSQIDNQGAFDFLARRIFSSIGPGLETQFASRVLTITGQDGTGAYTHGDVLDLTKPFRYKTQFTLPDYVLLPGPGAIQVAEGLGSLSNIGATFEQATLEKREYAMPMIGRHVTETTTITLPDDVKVPILPEPASIASQWGTYKSAYEANGRTITVTRNLDINLPGALLEPDQYPGFRKMGRAVKRDLRTQLVYD
ncbi:DUF3857 domain-containing protein [Paraburkholderia acidicola]|uniref:DUF3857 domain-containing protein n=1 Tax=Paraburkholderia acidicola TaxID=1912599 RepID=A0ABV1LUN9_9BURK